MSDLASFLRHMANPNNFNDVTCERLRLAADACDALEASQARIAAYECLQQSTQTRVRELEDDNSALKLSLSSGGGRLSSGAKIWLQQKERAEQAEARVREQQADKELLASQNITLHRQREQAEARVAVRELQISSLFARIEHGDETHRAWLKSALGLHFADTAREAERLLEELKLLRSLRDQVNWFAAHPNGWTADTFEGTRDALTALHEFDDKETK